MTPEQKEARAKELAAEKARRDAAAMTCQICGRKILAETGVIAHHGYQRPGDGFQSASCFGAREKPFEADRDRLAQWIDGLKNGIAAAKIARDDVAAEKSSIVVRYYDRTKPKNPYGFHGDNASADVTRDNFETLKETNPDFAADCRTRSFYSFDRIKESDLARRDRKIKELQSELDEQQKRFDAWTMTHRRIAVAGDGFAWEKISG